MIQSYRDKKTERFAAGLFVSEFQGFEQQAANDLPFSTRRHRLATLKALPSNRLEALKGPRQGEYSIRINRQWRTCFAWPDGTSGPRSAEIVDYP